MQTSCSVPKPDILTGNVELVNEIVQTVIRDSSITKVDDLARLFGINKRTLQRLFSRYVGVSPKWVVRRHRLSLDLGYCDQAHFIKDFKAVLGRSPEEYVREI